MEIKPGDIYIRRSNGSFYRVKMIDDKKIVLESEDGSRLSIIDIRGLEREYGRKESLPPPISFFSSYSFLRICLPIFLKVRFISLITQSKGHMRQVINARIGLAICIAGVLKILVVIFRSLPFSQQGATFFC